jgi:hypothetical protein
MNHLFRQVCVQKSRPTKRAPDAGDSGAIPSLFLRLSLFPVGRRPAARPSAGNANRWVAGHMCQLGSGSQKVISL